MFNRLKKKQLGNMNYVTIMILRAIVSVINTHQQQKCTTSIKFFGIIISIAYNFLKEDKIWDNISRIIDMNLCKKEDFLKSVFWVLIPTKWHFHPPTKTIFSISENCCCMFKLLFFSFSLENNLVLEVVQMGIFFSSELLKVD